VPLFDRRPLHERLLAQEETAPPPPSGPVEAPLAPSSHPGVHGGSKAREWDCVVTAEAPAARGDAVRFVTLADGEIVVEEGDDGGDLSPLADAVERFLPPPYRARAVRQQGDVFAVGARGLEIVELPGATGESLTLTAQDGSRELEVDGEREFGGLPALERLGERVGSSYVVRAERVDGSLFEVVVDPL